MTSAAIPFPASDQVLPTCAPPLPHPKRYRPQIGLIGCGNIATSHLEAYGEAGWDVVAFCDPRIETARHRAETYCPSARIYADYRDLLKQPGIDVVDLALHPEHRLPVMEDALRAGKHVLSQKPFVLDLDAGRKLVKLAEAQGVFLGVNQNARWAPYVSYLRNLCQRGHLGHLQTANLHLNWDHTWIRGTDFEQIRHLLLYDFAIHWIDMVRLFFGGQSAREVFASVRSAHQTDLYPPLIGSVAIVFEHGIANLLFDGNGSPDARESITLTGSRGIARAHGALHAADNIEVFAEGQHARPKLTGRWYREGFRGAMGELLCAIESGHAPSHSAADNLSTLELLFAAIDSADSGQSRRPGTITTAPPSCRLKGGC